MYELKKDGRLYGYEEKIRYVKLQSNGAYALCSEEEAQGIVINNDYVAHLDGRPELPVDETVSISKFHGAKRLKAFLTEGAALAQASTEEPAATVGVLADGFPEWKPGMVFEKRFSLFQYDGKVGFTRQANITAMEHQPPFSTGMEAIYGVRSIPNEEGIYPYIYNMAASVGMKIENNGVVYECYQAIDPVLYSPEQLPAHFKEV